MPQHFTVMVRNQSSRNGSPIRRVIIHTTEGHDRPGIEDLRGLASFFDRPGTQASSHTANDKEGNSVRMVPDERKAWTASNANPDSLNIEQIGFAKTSRAEWLARPLQLDSTAKMIAEWSAKYGIPIRFDKNHGVTGHVQVSGPGGHWDPGPGYPYDVVLQLARRHADGQGGTRKERAWARSLRIVRAKARRRGWTLPFRVRARKLKKLVARG